MKICCIYKIKSPSGRIYIGQTTDYNNRFRCYKRLDCKHQRKLYSSFLKYGVGKHTFEIIHRCEIEELNNLEIYYIQLFDSLNKNSGLNLREGGGSKGRLSEDTKKLLSENRKGKKHHNYGKKLSEITKLKISASNKGRIKTIAERKKISESKKGLRLSDKQKMHLSIYHKGRTGALCKNSIPVLQYDKKGNLIKVWSGGQEASRELNINQRNISLVCHKKRLTAGGFYWSFESAPLTTFSSHGDRKKKEIIQFSKSGLQIKEWDSTKSAQLMLGYNAANISACLRGKIQSAYGFVWKFKTLLK